MTSNGTHVSALFLAVPTLDGLDGADVRFDGSEEAMRRLRHPFAVSPTAPAPGTTALTGEGSVLRD
ncbi:hypothetical protein ACTMSW_16460 [Micromonospora sp. BQ11]|uniref:hypothetical protein n=1 Tax=Micromonospora sp. BQ11 TaxID=3452212 RepID=UPI003F8AC49A